MKITPEQAKRELERREQEKRDQARAELINRQEYKAILPYNFRPREYQDPFFEAMNQKKRAVLVWHRRAGKDKSMFNYVIEKMFERVGTYYYFLQTYAQGKKIIWNGIDRDGFKVLKHLPEELRAKTNNSDMMIEAINGSIFQVIGTDNIDSIVGTNPIGCVFSEYSLQNPVAWDLIRPILAENGGWAIFNMTPRGKNHGWDMAEMAKQNKAWYYELRTVLDTKKADGTPVITEQMIQEERDAGMDESLIQQEFYCDFNAANQGAYYGRQMEDAENQDRIKIIEYEPELPVETIWDLGISDSTAIIFLQILGGREFRLIDYYESNNEPLEHYLKYVLNKPYQYSKHWAPHDIQVREYTTGMSRWEAAKNYKDENGKNMGIKFKIVPNISIQDGIDATRRLLPKCWFDTKKDQKKGNALSGVWWLVNALKSYHKEYDEKRHCYRDNPLHDWSSHAADAMRYLSVASKSRLSVTDAMKQRQENKIKYRKSA